MVSPVVLNHTQGTIYHSAMLEVQNRSRPAILALGCRHEGPKKHSLTCEARTTGRSMQWRHCRPLTRGARQLCRQDLCLKGRDVQIINPSNGGWWRPASCLANIPNGNSTGSSPRRGHPSSGVGPHWNGGTQSPLKHKPGLLHELSSRVISA